jgi:hypothetical protein
LRAPGGAAPALALDGDVVDSTRARSSYSKSIAFRLPFLSCKRAAFMSFQAYLDNIQTKTGKSPAELRDLAAKKGYANSQGLLPGVKAGDILAWLKQDFGLGHGHAMAVVALLKGSRKEGDR